MSISASIPTSTPSFQLSRNAFGQLIHTDADGNAQVGVQPVRAFPIGAPDEGLSIMGSDGHELVWIPHLHALPPNIRELLQEELSQREFFPSIQQIEAVSTFSTPSTWTVQTDRGQTEFVLKGEEDIRRLPGAALLIASSHGVQFIVKDMGALNAHSRKLLSRFL
jgi:hypothetical protein